MKLTQSQEARVTHYLRELNTRLLDVPEEVRRRALGQVKTRIESQIVEQSGPGMDDAALDHVLDRLGSPDLLAGIVRRNVVQAANRSAGPSAQSTDAPGSGGGPSLQSDERRSRAEADYPSRDGRNAERPARDRVWLGICAEVAQRLALKPVWVRTLAVIAGIAAPPLVLTIYLCMFAWGHITASGPDTPPVSPWRLARQTGIALAWVIALHAGASMFLWVMDLVYAQLQGGAVSLEARWTWLAGHKNRYLFWALVWVMPVAVLSGLPVPAAWRGTLTKVAYAGIALYAVWLCYGLASYFVGLLLAAADGGGAALLNLPVLDEFISP